jgi:hypothetical protein
MTQQKTEKKDFSQLIENHKKKGIETHTITCDNGMSCLITKPTIQVLRQVFSLMVPIDNKPPDYIGAGELIVKECFVAGDKEILNNEALLFEAGTAAISIVEMKTAEIKKN